MGLNQAELLANYLRGLKVDAVYSSPLKRALDVATSIAQHDGLDVNVTRWPDGFGPRRGGGLDASRDEEQVPKISD